MASTRTSRTRGAVRCRSILAAVLVIAFLPVGAASEELHIVEYLVPQVLTRDVDGERAAKMPAAKLPAPPVPVVGLTERGHLGILHEGKLLILDKADVRWKPERSAITTCAPIVGRAADQIQRGTMGMGKDCAS